MGPQCGLGGGANQARAGIQSAELLEAGGLEAEPAVWNPDAICLLHGEPLIIHLHKHSGQ